MSHYRNLIIIYGPPAELDNKKSLGRIFGAATTPGACVCVFVCVRPCVLVVNGSLDLTARAARLQAFLFDLATIGTATEFTVQRQMNRARCARYKALNGNRTLQLFRDTRPNLSIVFYGLLALKLSLARCYRWRAASTPSK